MCGRVFVLIIKTNICQLDKLFTNEKMSALFCRMRYGGVEERFVAEFIEDSASVDDLFYYDGCRNDVGLLGPHFGAPSTEGIKNSLTTVAVL